MPSPALLCQIILTSKSPTYESFRGNDQELVFLFWLVKHGNDMCTWHHEFMGMCFEQMTLLLRSVSPMGCMHLTAELSEGKAEHLECAHWGSHGPGIPAKPLVLLEHVCRVSFLFCDMYIFILITIPTNLLSTIWYSVLYSLWYYSPSPQGMACLFGMDQAHIILDFLFFYPYHYFGFLIERRFRGLSWDWRNWQIKIT